MTSAFSTNSRAAVCPKVSSALSGEAQTDCPVVAETQRGKLALSSGVLFLSKQASTHRHHEMHLKCESNVKRSDLRNVVSLLTFLLVPRGCPCPRARWANSSVREALQARRAQKYCLGSPAAGCNLLFHVGCSVLLLQGVLRAHQHRLYTRESVSQAI